MALTTTSDTEYQLVYRALLDSFKEHPVSGAEVGELIAVLSLHFSDYNLRMIHKLRAYNRVAKEIETQTDENGKSISSTKAKVLSEATDEAHDYELARAHVQNIEQNINALKSLQKGVLGEYARS